MAVAQNTPTFSILKPSKIYPNWDFWFENIPSGNPTSVTSSRKLSKMTKYGALHTYLVKIFIRIIKIYKC
jgi:hypothetical protein